MFACLLNNNNNSYSLLFCFYFVICFEKVCHGGNSSTSVTKRGFKKTGNNKGRLAHLTLLTVSLGFLPILVPRPKAEEPVSQ